MTPIAPPALAPLVKGSREWTLAWAEVAAHDAGLGVCEAPEKGWRYVATVYSRSGLGIVHRFESLYVRSNAFEVQATRAYKAMGTGRRAARRSLLDAHFDRCSSFNGAPCQRCTSPIYGEGYLGTSLAVAEMAACGRDCALELIGADTATDSRATQEMAPLSASDVEAERASARKARAAEDERILAAACVEAVA